MGSAGGVRAPCTNRRLQSNHLPAFSLMWRRGGETHRSEGWAHKGKPAYSGHYPNAVDRGCTWTRNVRCDRNKPESVPAHRKSCTKDRKRPKHKRTTNDTHRRPCRFASSSTAPRATLDRGVKTACANTHDPNDAVTRRARARLRPCHTDGTRTRRRARPVPDVSRLGVRACHLTRDSRGTCRVWSLRY